MARRAVGQATRLALLWSWAIAFSLLLPLVGGLPLSAQLSSDAEWYAVALMRLARPPEIAPDDVFALHLLPAPEQAVLSVVAEVGRFFGMDRLEWSAFLSLVLLLLYVTGLYALIRTTLNPIAAWLVTAIAVVPVHALGGTTLGFQANGFVPRDLALALATFVLLAYLRAPRDTGAVTPVFLACGLLANAYSMLFAHLALVLVGSEVIRDRSLRPRVFAFGAAFLVGASPTVVDVLTTTARFSAPDPEVLRVREGFLLVGPSFLQSARRPMLYVLIVAALVLASRRTMREQWRALGPWVAILVSAAAMSIAGVVVENVTPFTRYLPSRASVFFLLAAMVIVAAVLPAMAERRWGTRGRTAGLLAVLAVFALQSNLPTVYRQLSDASSRAAERRDLQQAARQLRATTPPDAILIAPADEVPDLAASLRTYARRRVYVSFKDVGIVLYDGVRGRALFERWRTAQEVLASQEHGRLRDLMQERGITAALLPERLADATTREAAQRLGAYLIVRR